MPSDPETEALRQRLDALVKDVNAAEAKAAAARRRVQAARLLLEEQATAANLERKAAAAKGLLLSSSSSSTTSDMVDGAAYDSALVTNLHVQATTVPNVRQMALTRYSLADHVLSDNAFTDDPVWTRMDVVVLCWLTNTITVDLQEVVREHGRPTRHLWLALENQFLSNHETRTLHLDAAFYNFLQGDLSMTEYCCKFKGMADALADLGSPVNDRILVFNILHGLNQCFEHLGATIRRSSPFPNFLKVRDDLLLEEIHLDIAGSSATTTTLYTSTAPPTPKPQPSASSRPPNSTNNRNKNNNPALATTAVVTAARTTAAMVAVVVTLATPPRPPLDPPATTAGPLLHGRRTSTRGKGTSPCTPVWYLRDTSAHKLSWLCQVTTRPWVQDWVADSGALHHTTPPAGNISKPRPLNSSSPSTIVVGNGSSPDHLSR
jgi:hypothetical protein